jgi:hypothetical protein
MSLHIVGGLSLWTVTLEDGTTRTVTGGSADNVVSGQYGSPVVSAVRGAVFAPSENPPVATTLTPATVAIGAASFTLKVTGSNFSAGAVIVWDGAPRQTTVVSATEVSTPITTAGIGLPRSIPVKVRALSGLESAELAFAVTATGREGDRGDDDDRVDGPRHDDRRDDQDGGRA